ncbi:MAG: hypothetical protein AB7U20_06540 [Planctomycetaceae bacterium]
MIEKRWRLDIERLRLEMLEQKLDPSDLTERLEQLESAILGADRPDGEAVKAEIEEIEQELKRQQSKQRRKADRLTWTAPFLAVTICGDWGFR